MVAWLLNKRLKSAHEAVQTAATTRPELRQLLTATWGPNDPTELRGEGNDLEVLFGAPDFKQIRAPASPSDSPRQIQQRHPLRWFCECQLNHISRDGNPPRRLEQFELSGGLETLILIR